TWSHALLRLAKRCMIYANVHGLHMQADGGADRQTLTPPTPTERQTHLEIHVVEAHRRRTRAFLIKQRLGQS
ncbi:MAG: hypothetical protein ACPIOQ_31200, partial [Promethearchaeia archaeon]